MPLNITPFIDGSSHITPAAFMTSSRFVEFQYATYPTNVRHVYMWFPFLANTKLSDAYIFIDEMVFRYIGFCGCD